VVVGDRASSFVAFYDGNYPSVCRALSLALRDPQLAEEAAQEAFTRAYVYWRRVGRMERPAGWVYVVAIRIAFKRRRPEVTDTSAAVAPDFVEGLVERETLRVAIGQLPERQRIAIVLHYLADLPLADVASAMGCAIGTVKSTLHAARTRLEVDVEEVQRDAS
jgi:RNA polymerase sigma-70 factor, ECF subfamily